MRGGYKMAYKKVVYVKSHIHDFIKEQTVLKKFKSMSDYLEKKLKIGDKK